MTDSPESRLDRALAHCVALALRFDILVLLGATLLTVLSAIYVAGNLGIRTDTEEMLSPQLEWRKTLAVYRAAFPQYADTIVVVVDGLTPDETQDAAAQLAADIAGRTDLFSEVFYLPESEFLRRNQLLYLDTDELESLADGLAAAQPFIARLTADPSLRGLAQLLVLALERSGEADGLPLAPALQRIDAALRSVLDGAPRPLSWQAMLTDRAVGADDLRALIVARPLVDYSQFLPGEAPITAIRALVSDGGYGAARGVNVRLTGSAVLARDNLDSVTRGARRAGILAFVLVSLCLIWGLRSPALIFANLVILMIGLVFTAAFAAFAIGTLNMISVAFAALYVGLAAAFTIHYALRVQELLIDHAKPYALVRAAVHVGGSMTLCALASAVGFYSFIPTDFKGVAELGLIAGTGMLIGFAINLTVLPALLNRLPIKVPRIAERGGFMIGLARLPQRHARLISYGALALAVACLAVIPAAHFDTNPIHLQAQNDESVTTFRDLIANSARSPYSISIVAADAAEAARLRTALEALPTVDGVGSINDFVPGEQDEKLAIIDDLALTLGPDLETADVATAPDDAAQIEALRKLHDALRAVPDDAPYRAVADSLRSTLAMVIERAGGASGAALIAAADRAVMGSLRGRLDRLRDSLMPGPIAIDTLPAEIRDRWITADGRQRIEVLPRYNLDDNDALHAFVDEVQSVAGAAAIDTPVIMVEAARSVVAAFTQALTTSIVVTALLLWLILRRFREVALVMAPLLLAGLLTCAICIGSGMSFNFANVIALPLLLGIGVDNALHILHRFRTDLGPNGLVLTTSTARAVLFDALTTACGFGNLAASAHVGTASMGVMLSIGLIVSVIYSLIVLPAMLTEWPVEKMHGAT